MECVQKAVQATFGERIIIKASMRNIIIIEVDTNKVDDSDDLDNFVIMTEKQALELATAILSAVSAVAY